MTVIYIDEIFLRNAMIDLFLISMTARLAGLTRWRKSYFIAAFTGGLYAALSYLPDWFFLTSVPVQCAAGVGLALIAFGYEKYLIRLTILFFAVSSGFAGFALALRLFAARASVRNHISNIPNHIIFQPISENRKYFQYFLFYHADYIKSEYFDRMRRRMRLYSAGTGILYGGAPARFRETRPDQNPRFRPRDGMRGFIRQRQ